MGSISGKLGLSKQKGNSRSKSSPFFRDTGYSSFDKKSRKFTLDPSIRLAEDSASQQYAGLYGDFGSSADRFLNQSSDLRGRLSDNRQGYLSSILSPIRERFSSLRGQAQQDLGIRRLSGSTFANDTLRDIDTQASREEANATALANQDLIRIEQGLNESELQALNTAAAQRAAITGESLDVAKTRAARELAIFGLGSDTKNKATQRGTSFSLDGTFKAGGGRSA